MSRSRVPIRSRWEIDRALSVGNCVEKPGVKLLVIELN